MIPVVVEPKSQKVKFGTVEFLDLRTEINTLLDERNSLKRHYEANKKRYAWICNKIRSLADSVFFEPSKMKQQDDSAAIAAADAYAQYIARKKEKKTKKVKPGSFSYQKGLF